MVSEYLVPKTENNEQGIINKTPSTIQVVESSSLKRDRSEPNQNETSNVVKRTKNEPSSTEIIAQPLQVEREQEFNVLDTIPADWKLALQKELEKSYFKSMISKLQAELVQRVIYPPCQDWFNFMNIPLAKIKVIIIGTFKLTRTRSISSTRTSSRPLFFSTKRS